MSTTPSKPAAGSKSPVHTPEQQIKVLGGMPPVKTEDQIFTENTPKKAPGSVAPSN